MVGKNPLPFLSRFLLPSLLLLLLGPGLGAGQGTSPPHFPRALDGPVCGDPEEKNKGCNWSWGLRLEGGAEGAPAATGPWESRGGEHSPAPRSWYPSSGL